MTDKRRPDKNKRLNNNRSKKTSNVVKINSEIK